MIATIPCSFRLVCILPKATSSEECVSVVAHTTAFWRFTQIFGDTTSQHEVIGMDGSHEPFCYVGHMLPPSRLPQSLQTAKAHVMLVASMLIREVGQVQRHHDTIGNEGRAETGPQAQKKHETTLITPQGLHRRVIDHLHRTAKGPFEIKSDPAWREVLWLLDHATVLNDSRIADRDCIVLPIRGKLFDSSNHLPGRQLRTAWKRASRLMSRGTELHVGATNVYDKHFHGVALLLEPTNRPSIAFTFPSRRSWRWSPLYFESRKALTSSSATASPMTRPPLTRTFISSCSTPWCAE